MPKIEIIPATKDHIPYIANNIRNADVVELKNVFGVSPLHALNISLKSSTLAYTGMCDDKPACMFGVSPATVLSTTGIPWLISTEIVDRYPKEFLVRCKKYVNEFLGLYDKLENIVDAYNLKTIVWLRWLDFHVSDPVIYTDYTIRRFVKTKHDIIREATESDLDELVKLGKKFHQLTNLSFIPYDDKSVYETLKGFVNSDTGNVFVLIHNDVIVGGISGSVHPVYWNYNIIASQQFGWFVDRINSNSLKLFDKFENWAKEKGATVFFSGAKYCLNYDRMVKFLNRRKYYELESILVKGE